MIEKNEGTKLDVALLAEGVDRNVDRFPTDLELYRSPSSRRARIEIAPASPPAITMPSPSSRRVWIEIFCRPSAGAAPGSPSSRRAWIEMWMRLFLS